MKIYHGSAVEVPKPLLGKEKPNNDYGRGFYCTEQGVQDINRASASTLASLARPLACAIEDLWNEIMGIVSARENMLQYQCLKTLILTLD